MLGFLDDAVEDGKPFFLTAATVGPHANVVQTGEFINNTFLETGATLSAPVPAKRHAHLFPDAIVPRTPSFNPANVSSSMDFGPKVIL